MSEGLQFFLEINQKMSGANVASELQKAERAMNSTGRSVQNLERAYRRMSKGGKASAQELDSIGQALDRQKAKLGKAAGDFVKLSSAADKMKGKEAMKSFALETEKVARGFDKAAQAANKFQANVAKAAKQGNRLEQVRAQSLAADKRLRGGGGSAGGGGVSAGSALRELSPRLDDVTRKFQVMRSSGLLALGGVAAAVGVVIVGYLKLVSVIGQVTAKLLDAGVKTAVWLEGMRNGLARLSGGAAQAGQDIQDVAKVASDLGLDVNKTIEQFRELRLLQFGAEQSKQIILMAADMKALGADAQKVSSIIRAIGQIKGKGKLQMEELTTQLAETGIATAEVVNQLAKQLGKTSDEVRKMISAGKISADEGIEAIQAAVRAQLGITETGQAAREAATQLGTLWDRMKGKLQVFQIQLADRLLPTLQKRFAPLLDALLKKLDSPEAGRMFDQVAAFATSALNVLADLAQIMGGFIEGVIDGVAATSQLGEAYQGLDASRIQALVDAAISFGNAVGKVLGIVLRLIEALDQLPEWAAKGLQASMQAQNQGQQAGMQVGQGMAAGIRASASAAVAAATNMAAQVAAATRSALQIKSPSKLAEKYGRFYSEGFGIGAADESAASKAVDSLAKTPTIQSAAGGGGGGGQAVTITIQNVNIDGSKGGESAARDFMATLYRLAEGASISVGAGQPETAGT